MEELETELMDPDPAMDENLTEYSVFEETDSEDDSVEDSGHGDSGNEKEAENDLDESGELTEFDTIENKEQAEISAGTISGNDIVTISGNAVILPADFDFSMLGSNSEISPADMDGLIEVVENQTQVIYGVSFAVLLFLGVIAGILLVHGFRLRRT